MFIEFGFLSILVCLFLNIFTILNLYFLFFSFNFDRKKILILFLSQFLLLFSSLVSVLYSLFIDDFSLLYTYSNSNSNLPFIYKFSALWGAHEGSFLLFVFLFSFWNLFFFIFGPRFEKKIEITLFFVLSFIKFLLLLLLIFVSNPFERIIDNIPIDGIDLNPLLQDINLTIHPPILYLGYIGFSIPFSFSISLLFNNQLDFKYFICIYPWILISFSLLTFGIFIGSLWAYYELGWGGWWFWDPVENASLMPWLSCVILIHFYHISFRKNYFFRFVVLLSIVTFLFCLLGIFLVRSGLISSVHSFSSSSSRGFYFFTFFLIIFLFSLFLFFLRFKFFPKNNLYYFNFRDYILFFSLFLIIISLITIFIGTFLPLFIDLFFDNKISIGDLFFNIVSLPFLALSIFFIPFMYILNKYSVYFFLFSLLFSYFFIDSFLFWKFFYIFLFIWLFLNFLFFLIKIFFSLIKINNFYRSFLFFLSHFGILILVIGISISSFYSIEKDCVLKIGDSIDFLNYKLVFNRILNKNSYNYISDIGEFSLYKNSKLLCKIFPEKRIFFVSGVYMTESYVFSNFFCDIYLALGKKINENTWSCRFYYKPFISFLWFGFIVISLYSFLRFIILINR